ncbi:MAG: hypothetical protein GY751_11880, partial [Bacteroidetes bacterium]|nr:hypothetical protein [Bacteroidota bacterium]
MVIKKYTTKNGKSSSQTERLDAYTRQGKSFRKTQKRKTGVSDIWKKGALTALIPLAAAAVGTLNAQCQLTTASNDRPIGSQGNGIKIDVDGDMIDDFSFYLVGGGTININPLNQGEVVLSATLGIVKNLYTGYHIPSTANLQSGIAGVWKYGYGSRRFHSGNRNGVIGIKQGGKQGWIQINI